MAIFIFLFLFFAFRAGLVRGLQDTLADQTWGRAQFAIGSAITSMKHGGYGYSIAGPVKTTLEYAGLTGDPTVLKTLGLNFPDNLRNPVVINKAISKAVELKDIPNQQITGNGGDDIGMVDFVRLSFALFGFNMISFYLTYFTLFGVSLLCAVVAFRTSPGVLAVFSLLALGLAFVFASSLLNPEMNGVLDPRFLSTLSIVPAAHIAHAMLARSPSSAGNAALVVVQSCILVLGYWIRSSALWTLLALVILAAVLVGCSLRSGGKKDFRTLWPVAALSLVAVAHLSAVALALHPVYKSANERPYHGLWHAMVYALQFHPQWKEKYAAQFENATLDEQPEMVARKYLLRHPPSDPDEVYLTADRKYIRSGVTETYKRKALLEFVASDPKLVLESYFVHNVRFCYKSLSYHLSSLKRLPWLNKLGALVALMVIAMLLLLDKQELRRLMYGNLILTFGFLVSLSYLIITAPSYSVVADQFFMFLAIAGGWTVLAFAFAVKFIRAKA